MSKSKKLLALLLVVLTVFSCAIPAFAARLPDGTPITIKFDAGSGAKSPSPIKAKAGGKITLPAAPVRRGYDFLGWSSGALEYPAKATVTVRDNRTFVAEWAVATIRITLKKNLYGSIDGHTPMRITTKYNKETKIDRMYSPYKKGYTFVGWSTAKNGPVQYVPGKTYKFKEHTTLYGVWNPNRYTVTFYGADPKTPFQTLYKTHGTALKLNTKIPTKAGYTFIGWTAAAWGAGNHVEYKYGDSYKMEGNAKLFAVFKKSYTVSYSANLNEAVTGMPASQNKIHNNSIRLSGKIPIAKNYSFKCWNTKPDGTGTSYAAGAIFSTNANTTLYAVWTPKKFVVKFDVNGAKNMPSTSVSGIYGATVRTPIKKPVKAGYTFVGWSTSKIATGKTLGANAKITVTANATYYAIWKKA